MLITTKFTHDKVKFNEETDLHLVVTLDAPAIAIEKKRNPICVIAVVDISGSMGGDRLNYAKKSMLKMVDHLKPGDYCGLVAFESQIHKIQPPVEMTQASKDALKTKISDLVVIGGTNFSGGLLQGLEWANATDLPMGTMIRVIMFTDGQANEGVADPAGIINILSKNIGKASVSAFGYGLGCNQEMLTDLARKGEGNYAFIDKPDAALTAFGKELGGLLSTYAQDIVVDIAPHNGHRILEVISDVDVDDDGGNVKVTLPNILSEEKRCIVMKVRLSKQKQHLPRAVNAFDIKVDYDVLEDGKKEHRSSALKAKVQFVKPGDEQVKPTKDVDAVVGIAEMAKKQVEAEELVAAGNYGGANAIFTLFTNNVTARGLDALAVTTGKLAATYGSQASYKTSAGYRGSMRGMATRSYSVSNSDAEAASEMASIGASANMGDSFLSNHVHASTVSSFESGFAPVSVSDAVVTMSPADPLASVAGEIKAKSKGLGDRVKPKATSIGKKKSKRW